MRRLQAILLVIALTFAPTVLFAVAWKCACAPEYCTMAHGRCHCPMMQHERSGSAKPCMCCNCMRFPDFGTLAPLTEMIPARPAAMPGIVRMASDAPDVALSVLPGFLPSPFHPPRG